jgi:hypothetical protein
MPRSRKQMLEWVLGELRRGDEAGESQCFLLHDRGKYRGSSRNEQGIDVIRGQERGPFAAGMLRICLAVLHLSHAAGKDNI